MRGEIKKMGSEGVRLLEQREKEITEMRNHLSNVLKVMESRYKVSSSLVIRGSCILHIQLLFLDPSLLKP